MSENERIVLQPLSDVNIKIDVSLIPEYQREQLAEFAIEITRKVFARPGEEDRYQAWLYERREGKKK